MKNPNYTSETAAHHSRLWNRNIEVQLTHRHLMVGELDLHQAASPTATKRVYASLAVLAYLLERISRSEWAADVVSHFQTGLAAMNLSDSETGCPPRWTTKSLWT